MNDRPIRRLDSVLVKSLEAKNEARSMAGLPPIKVKVRRCLRCDLRFESMGARTCGCVVNKVNYAGD